MWIKIKIMVCLNRIATNGKTFVKAWQQHCVSLVQMLSLKTEIEDKNNCLM
jgi:hypothetical protein